MAQSLREVSRRCFSNELDNLRIDPLVQGLQLHTSLLSHSTLTVRSPRRVLSMALTNSPLQPTLPSPRHLSTSSPSPLFYHRRVLGSKHAPDESPRVCTTNDVKAAQSDANSAILGLSIRLAVHSPIQAVPGSATLFHELKLSKSAQPIADVGKNTGRNPALGKPPMVQPHFIPQRLAEEMGKGHQKRDALVASLPNSQACCSP
jgi:hypothetical protein